MELRNLKILTNYAEIVVKKNTKRLVYDDWKYVGKDIKTNKDYLKPVIAKRIVMSNLELANKRILDILAKNQIDENTPFELLNKAKEIAIRKENSSDLIKIAKELVEIQDLKPQKVTISESRQQINYDNMLPEKTKKTISTTKTVNNDNNDNQ